MPSIFINIGINMTPLKVLWPIDQSWPNPSPNNRLERSIKMAQAIEHNIFNWLYHHKARRIYILEWQSTNLNLARLDLHMKYFEYWERGDAYRMARDLRAQGIHALVKVLDFKKLLEMPIAEFEALNSPNKAIVRKWRETMRWHVKFDNEVDYEPIRYTKTIKPAVQQAAEHGQTGATRKSG